MITGFCGVAHDVDAQYENIRNLAVAGEAGMILCYVGLILPALDPRPIQLADELGFILICMPENEPKLCYSEVTNEVMDAIIRDELNSPAFAIITRELPQGGYERRADPTPRAARASLAAEYSFLILAFSYINPPCAESFPHICYTCFCVYGIMNII